MYDTGPGTCPGALHSRLWMERQSVGYASKVDGNRVPQPVHPQASEFFDLWRTRAVTGASELIMVAPV